MENKWPLRSAPNRNGHHMPLNETPTMRIFCIRHWWEPPWVSAEIFPWAATSKLCLSFSGCWQRSANGRSQNALPFQPHYSAQVESQFLIFCLKFSKLLKKYKLLLQSVIVQSCKLPRNLPLQLDEKASWTGLFKIQCNYWGVKTNLIKHISWQLDPWTFSSFGSAGKHEKAIIYSM